MSDIDVFSQSNPAAPTESYGRRETLRIETSPRHPDRRLNDEGFMGGSSKLGSDHIQRDDPQGVSPGGAAIATTGQLGYEDTGLERYWASEAHSLTGCNANVC